MPFDLNHLRVGEFDTLLLCSHLWYKKVWTDLAKWWKKFELTMYDKFANDCHCNIIVIGYYYKSIGVSCDM